MDMTQYRQTSSEQARTADLVARLPARGRTALDVGARDGHFSRLLAERFERVVALDLDTPTIDHPRVQCVKGDATRLQFDSRCFDFVFCAEVLEHIPEPHRACLELERVAAGSLLIGVPYRQDLRVWRSTCQACGRANPPWGHVNSFDEATLAALFPACTVESFGFVGENHAHSNALAAALMDYAGNPYGSYGQDEPCVHCGAAMGEAASRTVLQKVATRLGYRLQQWTEARTPPHGNWLHMALRRADAPAQV